VRITRFTTGEDPLYGVLTGDLDEFGQPAEDSVIVALAGDPLYVGVKLLEQEHKLEEVRLLAPVLPRSKVVGIGRNYAAHAAEMGSDLPTEPLMFLKPNTSVIGPGDPIFYPRQSQRVDYEGELAVVIGRACKDVSAAQAADNILGYTIGNDVSARDQQKSDGQWTRAKGHDTFCPIGPWIVNDVDPADLELRTEVNGEVKQHSRTSLMIHDVGAIVEWISAVMTLLPGDLILTGTPAGVGPIEDGDTVSVTVEGIGTLTNPVVRKGKS
jgi:2-keto-4-pentenoate hydratase/2-oxohepta-3-ene-1,7-dioic acid hydratase in catechol pathway